MINQKKIEEFYDCIDESVKYMYENLHFDYLKGLIETCNNILEQDICQKNLDDDQIEYLENLYEKLPDANVEEIRLAMQYLILNAFKEVRLKNGDLTPDSIAYFMSYLCGKLVKVKNPVILDPLVGTANLLTCVANNLGSTNIHGMDNNDIMIKLAKIVCNMQDYNASLMFGDSLESQYCDFDLLVSDVPEYEFDGLYFPFEFVSYHIDSIKDDGYMVLSVPVDFLLRNDSKVYRDKINEKMTMIGLIELPNNIFKTNKIKVIIILKKKIVKLDEFLMVKIDDFEDQEGMHNILNKIEQWFIKMEEKL